MLLDGQQLGPVCKVVPLHSPRAAASHAAAAADHTRPQSPQVSLPAPAVALTCGMAAWLVHGCAVGLRHMRARLLVLAAQRFVTLCLQALLVYLCDGLLC